MRWNDRLFQPLRFLFSSATATLLHWTVMAVIIGMGGYAAIGTAVGACVGAIANYYLQRKLTFGSSNPCSSELMRYMKVVVQVWLANLFIFLFLNSMLGLSPLFAQGVTTSVVAFMSYYLYKRSVFNEQPSRSFG